MAPYWRTQGYELLSWGVLTQELDKTSIKDNKELIYTLDKTYNM